jgi:predicted HAD superfamily phosphohydrolase
MGQDARQTVAEIEETREELARKVDDLVGRAKVEAGELGKKLVVVGLAVTAVLLVGFIAKRRVRD